MIVRGGWEGSVGARLITRYYLAWRVTIDCGMQVDDETTVLSSDTIRRRYHLYRVSKLCLVAYKENTEIRNIMRNILMTTSPVYHRTLSNFSSFPSFLPSFLGFVLRLIVDFVDREFVSLCLLSSC
jgi:hypothetical protein